MTTNSYNLSNTFDTINHIIEQWTDPSWTSAGVPQAYTVGSTSCTPYIWNGSITIDDLVNRLAGDGLPIDAFERAKDIYRHMPKFPAANVSMDRDTGELLFELALPGYDLDDIGIEFENDLMLVHVLKDNALSRAKKGTKEDGNKILFHQGLKSGSVELKVPVPATKFKIKEANASYENGILSISIPRLEEAAPVRLKLKPSK